MKNSFKIAYLFSFFMVIALSSLYVHQIIDYTKETYFIQSYQKKIDSLSTEVKVLSYKSSASLPLSKVEEIALSMNFTEVENINYIEVMGNKVVVR